MPKEYNTWAECVGAGGHLIVDLSIKLEDKLNEEKLYLNYFCNEVKKIDKPA